MGYQASKVQLNYEFTKSIPTDNPKYQDYLAFKQKFGEDGDLVVIGITTTKLFTLEVFNAYSKLQSDLKKIPFVKDAVAIPTVIHLLQDPLTQNLAAIKVFDTSYQSQSALDSAATIFATLPFYKNMLYNPQTNTYAMGVKLDPAVIITAERTKVIKNIKNEIAKFEATTKLESHISGLPLVRTVVGDKIKKEMNYFLFGSILLSAIILLLFFRSFSTMLLSLMIVLLGVTWSLGLMNLFGYKITLLSALIPSLVVVIGVPNCIYFLNKYHTNFIKNTANGEPAPKENALIDMVSKMGVVTLFCNITAAIGFAVFGFTESAILKEFGLIAGMSIMVIFVLSFVILPSVLHIIKPPTATQTRYLHNKWMTALLDKLQHWATYKQNAILAITAIVLIVSILGMLRLKGNAHIVDDLPKTDKVFTDLKYFEKHFRGIMPLEIVVDSKKTNGLRKPGIFERVDSLATFIAAQPEMNKPLSLAEGFKFMYQGISGGDSATYFFPNSTIINSALVEIKKQFKNTDSASNNKVAHMFLPYIDSTMQYARVSVSMADVGTAKLPALLSKIEEKKTALFDTANYSVTLTGSSITFLEGSSFIINGLKESIFWAFLLIALCMLYLFKNLRILVISILPNIIPLIITAGVMGWAGIPLKPSTVLVFSVALGIAIDITIRFLVNYKQELPLYQNDPKTTALKTIQHTGLSIVYTSLVLIAGFVIFCLSEFGGTFALGWLTSLTLVVATLTNLTLLPILLMKISKKSKNLNQIKKPVNSTFFEMRNFFYTSSDFIKNLFY